MPRSPIDELADVDLDGLQNAFESAQAQITWSRLLRHRSKTLVGFALTLRDQSESARRDTERILLNLAA